MVHEYNVTKKGGGATYYRKFMKMAEKSSDFNGSQQRLKMTLKS
jgi:hypothetical protein